MQNDDIRPDQTLKEFPLVFEVEGNNLLASDKAVEAIILMLAIAFRAGAMTATCEWAGIRPSAVRV